AGAPGAGLDAGRRDAGAAAARRDGARSREPTGARRRSRAARGRARLPRSARARSDRLRRIAGHRARPARPGTNPFGRRMKPLLITDCDEVLLHMVRHFGVWLDEAHDIEFTPNGGDFATSMRRRPGG